MAPDKYLFVGGPANGERIELDAQNQYHMLDKCDTRYKYTRVALAGEAAVRYGVYVYAFDVPLLLADVERASTLSRSHDCHAVRHAAPGQFFVLLESSDNDILQYPCLGLMEVFETGVDGSIITGVFRLYGDGQQVGGPVVVRRPCFTYDPTVTTDYRNRPNPV